MNRESWAVVDLGFGDAGKGTVTDFLVRDRSAGLVVRFNGGAQAGHNVVTDDGRHHTFSQFCAGTFAGARGLLGPDFLLHPLGMLVEAEHLQEVGIADPWALTEVSRDARVITPYQQAAGRLREALRGEGAHGTCGVGVGECVADSLFHPDETLRAGDLSNASKVRQFLETQRERKRAELDGLGAEDLSLFEDPGLIDRVIDAWSDVSAHLNLLDRGEVESAIADEPTVIFEGAQGILLDETWGFHPHTTWSDCTFTGALTLAGDRPVKRLGVTRAYSVRHGRGPFPTAGTMPVREEHNVDDGPQGTFRAGVLDAVLLRYATAVCGGIDALAVTCLDHPRPEQFCTAYRTSGGVLRDLAPGEPADLTHRESLGAQLTSIEPVMQGADLLGFAEDATGCQVELESRGPRPRDKAWVRPQG